MNTHSFPARLLLPLRAATLFLAAIGAATGARAAVVIYNSPDGPPPTPAEFYSAAVSGDVEALRGFLTAGVNVNSPLPVPAPPALSENINPRTFTGLLLRQGNASALMLAAANRQPAAVEALLDAGANRFASTRTGTRPLDIAAELGDIAGMQQMLGVRPGTDAAALSIEVDLYAQRATILRAGIPMLSTEISSGKPDMPTPPGTYVVTPEIQGLAFDALSQRLHAALPALELRRGRAARRPSAGPAGEPRLHPPAARDGEAVLRPRSDRHRRHHPRTGNEAGARGPRPLNRAHGVSIQPRTDRFDLLAVQPLVDGVHAMPAVGVERPKPGMGKAGAAMPPPWARGARPVPRRQRAARRSEREFPPGSRVPNGFTSAVPTAGTGGAAPARSAAAVATIISPTMQRCSTVIATDQSRDESSMPRNRGISVRSPSRAGSVASQSVRIVSPSR